MNFSVCSPFAQKQTGSRLLGERMSHILGPPILKATATLVLLSHFVPIKDTSRFFQSRHSRQRDG